MKLKIGDKVYSKKDYFSLIENEFWISKNKYYEIVDTNEENIYVKCDNSPTFDNEMLFFRSPWDTHPSRVFKDYFYTPKELRKQKLDKIKKSCHP